MTKSIVLITGGTGTFGQAFAQRCLDLGVSEIRIFSRDEKKQYEMKQKYPNMKFYIGDIRDKKSIDNAMQGVNYVFHAAAMKQIPSCEQYPLEAIKTNVLGSENVLASAIEHKVNKIICLSTDKTVYPISTMGTTKLLMEKLALTKAKEQSETQICITRFCNLISSNGSVVPLFLNQIKNNQPLTITNPSMTRFMMSLQDAIDLVEYVMKEGKNGEIYMKNAQPCQIGDLAKCICKYAGASSDYPVIFTGTRPGEKTHETLLTLEEAENAYCDKNYVIITNNHLDSVTPYKLIVPSLMNETEILTLLQSMEK